MLAVRVLDRQRAAYRVATSRRWLQVFAAAMFINTSYGTLSYAFSVFVTDAAMGGRFGAGLVSLGFSLALLVSGFASVATGTVADLWGSRRLMAGGAVLGALSLALVSVCQAGWQLVAVFVLLMGPAMAATFYEPVYVLMNRWFPGGDRGRAYGVLTLLSGFSITIFTPLTQALVAAFGWREAALVLAAILLVVGLVVPALLTEPPAQAAGTRFSFRQFGRDTAVGLRSATPDFWLFTVAFFAGTVAFSGYSFHMVAQLEGRGFEAGEVARAIAFTGILSLPLRLLLPALSGRLPGTRLLAGCLLLLGVAAWVASVAGEWWQVWVYVALFGVVFGAIYPLRALVTAQHFAPETFGRLVGVQALFIAVARAMGPALIGVSAGLTGYPVPFRVAAVVLAASAVLTLLAFRRRSGPAGSPSAL